jgi:polyhydroxyalkanoate synthase
VETKKPNMSATSDPTQDLKKQLRRHLAAITGGLAPEDYANAWWDWLLGLAQSPQRQVSLVHSGVAKVLDNWSFAYRAAAGEPLPPALADQRFAGDGWNVWPFNAYARAYGNWATWWQEALAPNPAVKDKSTQLMNFIGRNLLDATSPANYLPTNPELLEATRAEAGNNLLRGFVHWWEDLQNTITGAGPVGTEKYKVGEQVAVTPGKVVLRNRLIELIQYAPQTDAVQAEPILITPAWIMKYYILDLSPRNSMIRYLVEKGHTVFVISWKNPDSNDRDIGMDDYVRHGFLDALDAVTTIVPKRKVHAIGYCIGGTLLTIAATALAQKGDERIGTLTLFAAQADFSEAGELSLFISPAQIDTLEGVMQRSGTLDSRNMGAAFAMLRSQELLWTPALNSYVRGRRDQPNDLMSWNADGTRMPCRMHIEYLTRLFLNNELAEGKFTYDGQPLDLANLRVPMFIVGTETDHVAPWRSAYKMRELTRSSDYTFLLTSGGHNAGIVSGPVHPKRHYRVRTWHDEVSTLTQDEWFVDTTVQPGSWWPEMERWLSAHSSEGLIAPPTMGNASGGYAVLAGAPGTYVHDR